MTKKGLQLLSIALLLNASLILGQSKWDGAFVTTWNTTYPGKSDNKTITIPINSLDDYYYDVDWDNDGVYDVIGANSNLSHTYEEAGEHVVRIRGVFPQIYFNNEGDCQKILNVQRWGDIQWGSLENAFSGCTNLQLFAEDNPDLSKVTSMSGAFRNCLLLSYGATIGKWDVSNVKDMSYCFENDNKFFADLCAWDVSSVTNMAYMFKNASIFNTNINTWDVSSVTNFTGVFDGANHFTGDISAWKITSAKNLEGFFTHDILSEKYDQLLISWSTQTLQHNVVFDAAASKCSSEEAKAARSYIISNFAWTINDGDDTGVGNTEAPTAQNILISDIPQNAPYTIPIDAFGYNDPNGLDFDHLLIYNPILGAAQVWVDQNKDGTIDGSEHIIQADDQITAADIRDGKLRLMNETGIDAAFIFQVSNGVEYSSVCSAVFKMRQAAVGTPDIQKEASLSIYPNPSNGIVNIASSSIEKGAKVEILSLTGDVVVKRDLDQSKSSLQEMLDPGMYFVRLLLKDKILTNKLIVL